MKTPKNLKKALSKKTATNFDSIFDPTYDPFMTEGVEEYKKQLETPRFKFHEALKDLSYSLCREVNLGYNHASDMYDNRFGQEKSIGKFLGLRSYVQSDVSSSSKDIENLDVEVVRDKFAENISQGLKESDFKDLKGFSEAYQSIQTLGYTGSEKDFETDLKNSQPFGDFVRSNATDYSG